MKARPWAAKPTPTMRYGQRSVCTFLRSARSVASLPAARLAASAVSPLRDQARNVRSAARRVRRVASTSAGSSTICSSATEHLLALGADDRPALFEHAREGPLAGDGQRVVPGVPG